MNRFFCWLTGGHRYCDQNIKLSSDYKTNEFIFRNYCVKCRKPDVIRISMDDIWYPTAEEAIEAWNRRANE